MNKINSDSSRENINKSRDSLYREFICNYWKNPIVVEEFTLNDKYLYAYLLTNTSSNLIQCYSLSLKLVSSETDLKIDDIKESISHMEKLDYVSYDEETKEILLKKYVRDNWTSSSKYIKGLNKQLNKIQSEKLINELSSLLSKTNFYIEIYNNTLSIGYKETLDTRSENGVYSNKELEDSKYNIEYIENEKDLKAFKKINNKSISINSLTSEDDREIANFLNIDYAKAQEYRLNLSTKNNITEDGECLENKSDLINYLYRKIESEKNRVA